MVISVGEEYINLGYSVIDGILYGLVDGMKIGFLFTRWQVNISTSF
jgi:hypothetical protein